MSPLLQRARLARSHLLGTGGLSGRGTSPTLKVLLGHPGRCPDLATLLICVFDDSGSMLGGADSTGLRYVEAALVFERVGRRCRCNRELAAVLHMNRPTAADLQATPLNRHAKTDLSKALTVPTDGDGASEMAATLQRAEQIALTHPNHKTTLAAFSDYELSDNMAVLATSMSNFPGDVHAVVMRSEPPQELLAAGNISVAHVASGEAPGAVAHALFDAMTVHRPGRRLERKH
jgi:hypothetical protein